MAEIKLSRQIARLELNKSEGAHIETEDGKYYLIKGASLEEAEKQFPNFKIWHKYGYWTIQPVYNSDKQ